MLSYNLKNKYDRHGVDSLGQEADNLEKNHSDFNISIFSITL